jgi:hypothetical protein
MPGWVGKLLKCLLALPVAYFGGNIVFGILAGGSWLPEVVLAIFGEQGFDIILGTMLWIVRVGLLLVLIFLIFETERAGGGPPARRP